MSWPRAERMAEPGLFRRLIDDAAVFPPGLTPLPEAVRGHLTRRSTSRYAEIVGPLLVPAAAAGELAEPVSGERLEVVLVSRPGSPLSALPEGAALLDAQPSVQLTGIELGWVADWRELQDLGVPVSVEIPRVDRVAALDDVGEAARDAADPDRPMVQAKLRTGVTESWAWPDEGELADFIRGCIDRDLGFKLTGGLHHAVRAEHHGEPQHGLLNVLAAVRHALNGAETSELASLLAERDPQSLLEITTRMSSADVSIVRAFFTASGCCNVLDPIGELVALGLVEEE